MHAPDLPAEFLEKYTDDERAEVESWWGGLRDDSRNSVCVLLDRRQDARAFVFAAAEDGSVAEWRTLPLADEPWPADDDEDETKQQQLEFFQHLLDHEEMIIPTEATIRTFRICVDHPAARKVRSDGSVDCDFRCPIAAADCPIRGLFADGRTKHCTLIAKTANSRRMVVIGHN